MKSNVITTSFIHGSYLYTNHYKVAERGYTLILCMDDDWFGLSFDHEGEDRIIEAEDRYQFIDTSAVTNPFFGKRVKYFECWSHFIEVYPLADRFNMSKEEINDILLMQAVKGRYKSKPYISNILNNNLNVLSSNTGFLEEMNIMNDKQLSVKTIDGLFSVRSLTGALRINDHHLLNGLATKRDLFNSLLDTKQFFKHYETIIDLLSQKGYICEIRDQPSKFDNVDHSDDTVTILAYKFNDDKTIMTRMFTLFCDSKMIAVNEYHCDGSTTLNDIYDAVNPWLLKEPISINLVTGFSNDGEAITTTRVLNEDTALMPIDEFYPFLNVGIDQLTQSFMDSNNNLMLLLGEPGTGKSSLLRGIISRLNGKRDIYQFCGDNVIVHPAFTTFVAGVPENSIIIMEDADNIITKREDGNFCMSALLNEIEGIISNHTKFFITTNLKSTADVDSALVRAGRLYNYTKFRKLSYEECEKIAAVVGFDNVNMPSIGSWVTLSQLMSDGGLKNTDVHKMGF